ncbi:MAG: anti-sigma factor domain-containing protein [Thermoleophilaceae bacterium]
MATFDQLSAEQRAIIELVLKQGQSYDQLADMLAMPSTRVRDLARDALVRLSPVSAAAVDAEWRGQIADYLLNAQSGPEQTATRGHLRRSEAARAWAGSVLDSLEQFYPDGGIPSIPDGEPGAREPRGPRRRREPAPVIASPAPETTESPPKAKGPLSPEARSAARRRRLAGAGGALALVLALAVLVWPIGVGPLALGDDDKGSNSSESSDGQAGTDDAQNADAQRQIVAQLALGPVESLEGSREAAGIAAIALDGEERALIVQAQLPKNEEGEAYQVWLYNADDKAVSLGAQVTDARGVFQGAGPLPDDFEKYRFVDVSREDIRGEQTHSGDSVLRGALADLAPPAAAEGGAAPTAPESP